MLASSCRRGSRISLFPPVDFWPGALVLWVPLLAITDRASTRVAVAFGLAQGVLTHLIGFRWIVRAMHDAMNVSWAVAVLGLLTFALMQGARTAGVVFLASRAQMRGWPLVVSFAPALVTGELVYPMFVPWYTALFVHSAPSLVQLAELAGPLLVSGWVALANIGLWVALERWCRRERRGALWSIGWTLLGVGLVAAAGMIRIRQVVARVGTSPTVRVGVIQGAIRDDDDRDSLDVHREPSLELVRDDPRIDFVVWPETAIPAPVPMDATADTERFFREAVLRDSRAGAHAESLSVPLLTGIVLERRSRTSSTERFNGAVLVDPAGRRLGTYTKRELAPIGEATPMVEWIPGLGSLLPPKAAFSRGEAMNAMELSGHRLGISICYEDVLYRQVLANVERSRPDLLVNLTSDAWFGDSSAAELHLALAKFRAVEHRRQLLRVTNDGVTSLIEPTGVISRRLQRLRPAAADVNASWLTGSTPFEAVGDAPWWLVTTLTCMMSVVKRVVPRRSSRDRESRGPNRGRGHAGEYEGAFPEVPGGVARRRQAVLVVPSSTRRR